MFDNIRSVHADINHWEILDGLNNGLHDDWRECDFLTVFLLETLFDLISPQNYLGHISFYKRSYMW